MIKKLKISFLIVILSLIVGVGYARATALNFADDTKVTVGSNNYTIAAGSEATSIVVESDSITVEVPSSGSFTFISPDRWSLDNDIGRQDVCEGSYSSLLIAGPRTIVITPNTAKHCSGGSMGGGGGGAPHPVVPPTPVPGCSAGNPFNSSTGQPCGPTVPVPGCSGGNPFNTITGASCGGGNSGNPSLSGHGPYNFGTFTLRNGSRGDAVTELQRFLNAKLNLGLMLDGKLGPKTIAVIKQWQAAHGLVADGLVGPKTKAMMNTEAQ